MVNPWIVGGGLLVIGVVLLIIFLTTRKKPGQSTDTGKYSLNDISISDIIIPPGTGKYSLNDVPVEGTSEIVQNTRI
jgi:hypothetical protein